MKSSKAIWQKVLPIACSALVILLLAGFAPLFAQTGSVISSVTPSNATPAVGTTITATITIDMTGVNAPDNNLGGYTATLTWNTAVLTYSSNSGTPAGFTGFVNTANAATGSITFNGANTGGAPGVTTALVVTFNVAGAGSSALDLNYTAMAAATTFKSLMPILTTNDASITASAPNTAPVASNVAIAGTAQVGQLLTGSYTYTDADADPQGVSTFRWLRNGTAIGGATAITYTLTAADLGALIIFEVTPVATSGVTPGLAVQSPSVGPVVAANSAPVASNVAIAGTAQVGQLLTGSYTYTDADADPQGVSTFRWLRNGTAIGGATSITYTLTAADLGALIIFEVTPVAASGVTPGLAVQSPSVGPVVAANTAPVASNVAITGTAQVGQLLTGSYTYTDADADPQGVSTFRWLRNGTAIGGATAITYTLTAADLGALIIFEVTPVAASGVTPGLAVQSPAKGPVVAANTAPVASNVAITGNPLVGQVLTGNYSYNDAEGDPQGASTFRWLRNGTAIGGATAITYTLVAADLGTNIIFEVTPVAQTGATPGLPVQSPAIGPIGIVNAPPTATNVSITGTAQEGQVLTGNYTYSDTEGDLQGTSTFRWLRNGTAIAGVTAITYTLTAADLGANIIFEVTPVAQTGVTPGLAVQSPPVGPVVAANYTLTATSGGNGTVTLNPTGGTYLSGTIVTLTPTPASGYVFGSWSGTNAGEIGSSGGIYTIQMNGNKSVQANFISTAVSGTLLSSALPSNPTPAVGSTITVPIVIDMSGVNPPNQNLGSFTASLAYNTSVLTYASNSVIGAGFTGVVNPTPGLISFNGANASGATGSFTVLTITFTVAGAGTSALDLSYSAMSATGTFNNLLPILSITDGQVVVTQYYTLTAASGGNGTVTLNPAGGSYATGTTVTLTPNPASGYQFSSWSGANAGNIVNTGGVYTILMDNNKTVQANFSQITYTLTATSGGNGTVSLAPTGGTYATGTTVTLTPTPASGYQFSSWSGANAGNIVNTGGVYTILMDNNKTVQANFTQITYTLTATSGGNGTVTLNPAGGTYASGSTVTLTPTPASGYQFNSWSGANSGDVVNTGGVYTILMNGNKTVQANFILSAPTGSVVATALPSNAAPTVGSTITVPIVINMSGVNAPNNALGSFTASLAYNTSILSYVSNSGLASGFTGSINPASGSITFNGANAGGATGTITVITFTFNVIGSGTSALDLGFSAMAAATTFNDLLPILTITDGQVVVPVVNYTLTATSGGNGTVTLNPTGGTYASGTTVTLTPNPASGYQFSYWSGANAGNIVNTGGIYTILMNGNKTVQANFILSAPTGSVVATALPSNAAPTVGSTITVPIVINMSGVNAPNNALGSFTASLAYNTSILSYVSNSGLASGFTGSINPASGSIAFNGANAGGATGTITVITFTFNVIGSGTSALDLGFSAMAAATTFNNLLPILTITDGQVVVPVVNYTLTATSGGNGTVTLNPTGGTYATGTTVTLTVAPASGYQFSSWSGANSGDVVNTGGVYTILMNGNKTVQANFTQITYTLTATSGGNGTVTLNPTGGTYATGTTVTLTVTPASGYQFSSWSGANSGDIVNTGGVYTILMNGNKTVQANFTATGMLGDVNNSGTITSSDALIILSCAVGLDVTQYCPMDCGDVNASDTVTSSDALVVLSYAVGLSVPYPVGQAGCPTGVTPCPGCE